MFKEICYVKILIWSNFNCTVSFGSSIKRKKALGTWLYQTVSGKLIISKSHLSKPVTYVSLQYLKITLKNLRTWFSNDFSRNVKITQKGGFLAIPPSKKSLMIWNLLLKMKFSINFDLTYCCYLQNYRGNLKKSW